MLLCLGKKSCHGNYYFLLDLSHSKYYLCILKTFSTLSRYDPVEHGVERKLNMFIIIDNNIIIIVHNGAILIFIDP